MSTKKAPTLMYWSFKKYCNYIFINFLDTIVLLPSNIETNTHHYLTDLID
ncbi:hypothetical protein JAO71_00425 [Olleya sp. YSTF-M6]|uniref:Uncharacterized protein n=1 Tax=Olleya sediminilitoris TaxID=2795739 RepID=A0ABS1WGJ4_9FLAO|nr:hypothetical protein [Olleya sediminilitoris]MBL7558249.1 hypothetical protein [Olleya sediminilitoris]